MAYVPEKMDENKIAFLANEMVKSFMTGKNSGEFVNYVEEYMRHYEIAKQVIISLEERQKSSSSNLLYGDAPGKVSENPEEIYQRNASMFR